MLTFQNACVCNKHIAAYCKDLISSYINKFIEQPSAFKFTEYFYSHDCTVLLFLASFCVIDVYDD